MHENFSGPKELEAGATVIAQHQFTQVPTSS
jgi:hypothetical protein